ncbi:MAG TPA: PrsW family glutamic-type intramembrane protease, partial [Bacillota bacterium]|nr:PrsW family glutamic-type intramembrane protease [Bacillota bacterium]
MLFFNPILIIASILPALYLMLRVYRLDRIEKEPPYLLFALFRLGILATVIAMVLEWIGSSILQSYVEEETLLYNAIMYFIIVAFSEEGAKYFLLKRRTWNDPNFNYTFDGIVYAVFVSLGFALAENIMYVM